ncbi:MAG: diacylglycerol kinase [Alphaproteobacteria bacterium]|nr:diacylglycerol kinase [Alphaproteobacteria bacterium]
MKDIQKYIQNLKQGIKRILNAFKFSFDGFVAMLKSEPAFRQDLFVCAVFIPIAFFVDVTALSRAMLVFSMLFVLFAESVNTAIETVVDRISKEKNPLSKKAKDIGSLIVLMAFINAALMWGLILFF